MAEATSEITRPSAPSLRKGISRLPMTIIGVGGGVGTGALFTGLAMAAVAGPGMIISWVIGAIIYSLIGIAYIDLSIRFPEAGGPARYALYTHGSLANLINSVGSLVWYLFIPPVESIATVEAIAHFDKSLLTSSGDLTAGGALTAIGLLIVYVPFNYYGIRIFARITNVIGGAKIALYFLLAIGFVVALSRADNFNSFGGFAPFGGGPSSRRSPRRCSPLAASGSSPTSPRKPPTPEPSRPDSSLPSQYSRSSTSSSASP